jgi:cytidylate kinase
MIQTHRGAGDLLEPPLHGNQGDREPQDVLQGPLGLTVAVSREAGARGGSIANRVGRKLGWQVYTQELLEFLCANESARALVLADVPANAALWAENQLSRLGRENVINSDIELGEMPRLILTLAARGGVILVGRGAGYLLPHESTLHVRVVAPLEERIAYMAQWLRLSREEAGTQVRDRDEQRAEFLRQMFKRRAGELLDYELILNSFLLGEELSSDIILAAVRGKARTLGTTDEED